MSRRSDERTAVAADNGFIARLKRVQGIGAVVPLVLICIVLSILTPNFLTSGNILNVLRQAAVYAILACGMTFVIITGGIDLSQGAMLALCHVVAAMVLNNGEGSIALAILSSLGVGLLIGFINGAIIATLRIPAFIVTMGMMQILGGFTLVITNAAMISARYDPFRVLGTGALLGVPIPIYIFTVVGLISQFVLSYTSSGRYIFALGSNEEAAKLSGVRVNLNKVKVYMLSGLMVGIAAIVYLARLGSAQPAAGDSYELEAIAAVVIGGTSMSGGEGGILGSILGAIIVAVIRNGLVLLGLSTYFQQMAVGTIIILAVAVDMLRNRFQSAS
ncbi:MAG: ABC transporter permease [Candidatus Excrementavichristensenella sp.]|jgi:ribose/xylose/arabinose/galactoside ABC-type transport system permease subunit